MLLCISSEIRLRNIVFLCIPHEAVCTITCVLHRHIYLCPIQVCAPQAGPTPPKPFQPELLVRKRTPVSPRPAGVSSARVTAGKSATSQSDQEQGGGGQACKAPPRNRVMMAMTHDGYTHYQQSKCESIFHVYGAGSLVIRLQQLRSV